MRCVKWLMLVTPTVRWAARLGCECANVCLCEWVCICLSGECSRTGDEGEYSIKLIQNTFPACLCLRSRIRPVKARGQSDGALPLWCMPPWFSPVLDHWCTTTGGQRTSQCSPDVCVRVYSRILGARQLQPLGQGSGWKQIMILFPLCPWLTVSGVRRISITAPALTPIFQVCQAVPCCGQNFPSGGLDWPLGIKKHHRTRLIHLANHNSAKRRLQIGLLKCKVCLSFVSLKAPKFILCNYCDISASISLLNEVEQFCLC